MTARAYLEKIHLNLFPKWDPPKEERKFNFLLFQPCFEFSFFVWTLRATEKWDIIWTTYGRIYTFTAAEWIVNILKFNLYDYFYENHFSKEGRTQEDGKWASYQLRHFFQGLAFFLVQLTFHCGHFLEFLLSLMEARNTVFWLKIWLKQNIKS